MPEDGTVHELTSNVSWMSMTSFILDNSFYCNVNLAGSVSLIHKQSVNLSTWVYLLLLGCSLSEPAGAVKVNSRNFCFHWYVHDTLIIHSHGPAIRATKPPVECLVKDQYMYSLFLETSVVASLSLMFFVVFCRARQWYSTPWDLRWWYHMFETIHLYVNYSRVHTVSHIYCQLHTTRHS